MIYKLNVQKKVKHYPSKEGVIATLQIKKIIKIFLFFVNVIVMK